MNGIAATLPSRHNDDQETIKRMMESMAHRGKGSKSFYTDEYIAIGQCGLGVINTTKSEKNLIISLDGYISNKDELETQLNVRDLGDSEIILEGFKAWSLDVVKRLRGNFSFIIWDKKNQALYGAKDHFGTRPLYYYHRQNSLVLASEIKAILEYPDFEKELNKDCIEPFLIFGFNPLDETFFKNVFTLNPGHCFIYKENKLEIIEYFKPVFEERAIDQHEAVGLIKYAIKDSIEKSIGNVEKKRLGAFLSSGVDSSYLAGLVKPEKTFTVGYKEQKYDEINTAKKTAQQIGIENIERYISKEEYLAAAPKVMYHFDEPISDPATIALYLGAEAASKEVDTIMCGEAADEFFGGYSIYQDSFKFAAYSKVPFFIRRIISRIFRLLPKVKGSDFLIRRGLTLEEWYTGLNWVFKEKETGRYIRNNGNIPMTDITGKVYKNFAGQSDLAKMMGLDIYFSLSRNFFANCDKMLSAFSLETRLPFADIKVFDVARILPFSAKVNETTTKVALRDAAREVLPEKSYQIKKLGFPVPLRVWLKEDDYYNRIKDMFDTDAAKDIFNHEKIIKLLDEHRSEKKDNYKKIWAIYTFLVWYNVYFKIDSEA